MRLLYFCCLLTFSVALAACQPPADQAVMAPPAELEFLGGDNAELDLPFSDAVRVGNLLFLSGQVGTKPGTFELVEGGTMAEARQTLENIKRVVEANGSSMDQVVKCTVMLEDMSEWGAVNEVYREFFPDRKPARSAFGTNGLALGASMEIECIAYVQ
ncbi:MAG: Rid family detoxifying hydrolase [Rhodothermales bacterium]